MTIPAAPSAPLALLLRVNGPSDDAMCSIVDSKGDMIAWGLYQHEADAIVAAVNERDSLRDSLQASQVAEQMARDDVRELKRENERLRQEFIAYLEMLSEQYPAAQSIGGTWLFVLLRERVSMLRAALQPLTGEGE